MAVCPCNLALLLGLKLFQNAFQVIPKLPFINTDRSCIAKLFCHSAVLFFIATAMVAVATRVSFRLSFRLSFPNDKRNDEQRTINKIIGYVIIVLYGFVPYCCSADSSVFMASSTSGVRELTKKVVRERASHRARARSGTRSLQRTQVCVCVSRASEPR